VDVSVQCEADGRFLVRLAMNERVVNVRLSATDISALVGSASWSERGIVRAGESAGAPVVWTSDGNRATLLIGRDDVGNREVPIEVPFRVVDEIVRGALIGEVNATFTHSYEPPPPDDDLVRTLRAAVAAVPDLPEAYLVARRTESLQVEILELGIVAHAGGDARTGRSEALRVALAPFSPPRESAPLGWVAYSNSPVPDEVRDAGIRLA
jgi:hypothetical protein